MTKKFLAIAALVTSSLNLSTNAAYLDLSHINFKSPNGYMQACQTVNIFMGNMESSYGYNWRQMHPTTVTCKQNYMGDVHGQVVFEIQNILQPAKFDFWNVTVMPTYGEYNPTFNTMVANGTATLTKNKLFLLIPKAQKRAPQHMQPSAPPRPQKMDLETKAELLQHKKNQVALEEEALALDALQQLITEGKKEVEKKQKLNQAHHKILRQQSPNISRQPGYRGAHQQTQPYYHPAANTTMQQQQQNITYNMTYVTQPKKGFLGHLFG